MAELMTALGAANPAGIRTRNVKELRISDLLMRSSDYPKGQRPPVVIQGEIVQETLRARLTRESIELEQAIIALKAKQRDRKKQLKQLRRFPIEDPCVNGDVITFDKTFPGTPEQRYAYAATRVDGRWYVTGKNSPHNAAWSELVNWMGLGVSVVYKMHSAKGRVKIIG